MDPFGSPGSLAPASVKKKFFAHHPCLETAEKWSQTGAPEAKKALWAKTSKHSSGDCRCCWSIYGRTTGRAHQRVDPRLLDSVHCMKSPGPRSMSTHAKMSSTVTAAAK